MTGRPKKTGPIPLLRSCPRHNRGREGHGREGRRRRLVGGDSPEETERRRGRSGRPRGTSLPLSFGEDPPQERNFFFPSCSQISLRFRRRKGRRSTPPDRGMHGSPLVFPLLGLGWVGSRFWPADCQKRVRNMVPLFRPSSSGFRHRRPSGWPGFMAAGLNRDCGRSERDFLGFIGEGE